MRINNKLTQSEYIKVANTDLNDYTTNGLYFFNGDYTPTNIPSGINGWLQVFTTGETNSSDLFIKQLWYRAGTPNQNGFETYVRTRSWNGVWGNWTKIANSQEIDVNSTTFTVTIPHHSANNLKSALIFCKDWAGVVSIANATQIWSFKIGGLGNVSMTPTIEEHTTEYVKIKLTFSETIYGGIKVIL